MSFQKEKYIERQEEKGEAVSQHYIDMYDSTKSSYDNRFDDLASRKDNMEYDLLTNEWMLEKVRANDAYAQNLYAAMCNNGFIKMDVIPILKQQEWGCSWRYAGGIIADMQETGDYIDWYCSGIRGGMSLDNPDDVEEPTEEQKLRLEILNNYVPEGCITDEIRNDLQRLGWAIAPGGDWEHFIK